MEINLASMFDSTAVAPAPGSGAGPAAPSGQVLSFAALFEQVAGAAEAQLVVGTLPEAVMPTGVQLDSAKESAVLTVSEEQPAALLVNLLTSPRRVPVTIDEATPASTEAEHVAVAEEVDDPSLDPSLVVPAMVIMAVAQPAQTGTGEPATVSIGAMAAAVPAGRLQSEPALPTGQKPVVGEEVNAPLSVTGGNTASPAVSPERNTPAAQLSQDLPAPVAAGSARATLPPDPLGAGLEQAPRILVEGEQKPVKLAGKPVALPVAPMEVPPAMEGGKPNVSVSSGLAIDVAIGEPQVQGEGSADTGTAFGDNDQQPATTPGHGLHQATRSMPADQPAPAVAATTATVNHESVIEQVRDRLATHEVKQEGNQVRLQLRPAELGELQITLKMDNQQLKVEILAENKAVKAALLEHADTLKEVLARQNIAVERFDVSTGGGFGQWFREGTRPEEQAQQSLARFGSNRSFRPPTEEGTGSAVAWQPRRNALVDVRL